jgi:hypothetical protein
MTLRKLISTIRDLCSLPVFVSIALSRYLSVFARMMIMLLAAQFSTINGNLFD